MLNKPYISTNAEQLLKEVLQNYPQPAGYWRKRFEESSPSEIESLKKNFHELNECELVHTIWTHDDPSPFLVSVTKMGEQYFEYDNPIRNKIKKLLDAADAIKSPVNASFGESIDKYNEPASVWVSNAKIIIDRHLKNHPLYDQMSRAIFHNKVYAFNDIKNDLTVVLNDEEFWDSNIDTIETEQPAPTVSKTKQPLYDVFISHANADKGDFVNELNESIKKLGVNIFYDADTLEWGDEWKNMIIEGTEKARFAIIVISDNFFGREWTEKELNQFMHRKNKSGEKVILPIVHKITFEQLKDHYPALSDIHAIDSSKFTADQIAMKFAKILIKDVNGTTYPFFP